MDDQPEAAERTIRGDMQDAFEPPARSIFTGPPRRRSAITALPTRLARPIEDDRRVEAAAATPLETGNPSTRERNGRVEGESRTASPSLDASYETLNAAAQCAVVQPAAAPIAATDDAPLLAILEASLLSGEPAYVGFARKESALRDAFAQLPTLAARALEKRLANPVDGDRLAEKFRCLTAERQQRLVKFLADARRRAALSGKR